MATQAEIEDVLRLFEKIKLPEIVSNMNSLHGGMEAVMRLMCDVYELCTPCCCPADKSSDCGDDSESALLSRTTEASSLSEENETAEISSPLEGNNNDKLREILDSGDPRVFMLKKIYEYNHERSLEVTPGFLGIFMMVSSARVAALLNKMEARDIIVRTKSNLDGRATVIKLTEHGKQIAMARRENLLKQVAKLADTIGIDTLREYVDLTVKISEIMAPPPELEI